MSRASLTLTSPHVRDKAIRWIETAPPRTRVEFKEPKRSLDQNAKMWASLTDVAQQISWHGMKLSPDDWKLIFLDALKREARVVPNIEGNGFVNLGRSSSDLSKSEMCDLIELILMFGAQHGVVFHDPNEASAGADAGPRGVPQHRATRPEPMTLTAGNRGSKER